MTLPLPPGDVLDMAGLEEMGGVPAPLFEHAVTSSGSINDVETSAKETLGYWRWRGCLPSNTSV